MVGQEGVEGGEAAQHVLRKIGPVNPKDQVFPPANGIFFFELGDPFEWTARSSRSESIESG